MAKESTISQRISTQSGILLRGDIGARLQKAVTAQQNFDENEKLKRDVAAEKEQVEEKIKTINNVLKNNAEALGQQDIETGTVNLDAFKKDLATKLGMTNQDDNSFRAKLKAEEEQLKVLEKKLKSQEKEYNKAERNKNTAIKSCTDGLKAFRETYPNDPIPEGSLHQAAIIGDKELFNAVQLAGIDINAQNKEGLTPLHCALQYGRNDLAKNLIAQESSLEIQDGQGLTPMDYIMRGERLDLLPSVIIKIERLKDPDKLLMMGRCFNSAVKNGNKAFAETILVNDPYASTAYSYNNNISALHIAAKNGNKEMVDFIIKHNSSKIHPEANKFPYDRQDSPKLQQDAKGNTALHEAVNGGNGEIVKLLLDAITDQEKKAEYLKVANNEGVPAINMAAQQGNRAVYEELEKAYGEEFKRTQECTNLRTQLETAENKKQEEAKRAEQERMKQAALNAAPSLGGTANQASQQSNGQSQSQFDPSKPVWREKMQPDGKAIIGDTTQGHFVQSRNDQGKFDYVMTNAEKDNNRYVLKIPSKPAGEFDEIVYQNGQIVDVKSEAKNSQLSDNMKKQIEDYKSKLTGVSVAIEKSPTPQLQARANSNAVNSVSTVAGSNPVAQGQTQRSVTELKNKIEADLQRGKAPNTTGQASQTQDTPPTSLQQANPLEDLLSGRKVVVKTGTNISQVPEEEMKKVLEPILSNGPSSQPQTISDQPVSPSPQVRDSAGRIKQEIKGTDGKPRVVWETPDQTIARESAAKMQKGLTDQAAASTPTSFEQRRKESQNYIRPKNQIIGRSQ